MRSRKRKKYRWLIVPCAAALLLLWGVGENESFLSAFLMGGGLFSYVFAGCLILLPVLLILFGRKIRKDSKKRSNAALQAAKIVYFGKIRLGLHNGERGK